MSFGTEVKAPEAPKTGPSKKDKLQASLFNSLPTMEEFNEPLNGMERSGGYTGAEGGRPLSAGIVVPGPPPSAQELKRLSTGISVPGPPPNEQELKRLSSAAPPPPTGPRHSSSAPPPPPR